MEMAFKGLSQEQTAACGKVGNITQNFWVICCSEKESLSLICLYLWLFNSFSVYLFWSLKYRSILQIIEKIRHVLWGGFFLGSLCWILSEILAVTVSRVLHWWQWILGQGFSDSDFNIYMCFINLTETGPTGSHREVTGSSCFKVLRQKRRGMLYCKIVFSHGGTKYDAKSVIRK